jgi:hypothetical protein
MKCYELKDDVLVEGLLITPDESGLPLVRVKSSDSTGFALDRGSAAVYKKIPALAPIRMKYGSFSRDGRELVLSRKVDRTALLRLDVHGGVGGVVTCTACAFSQEEKDGFEVEKVYEIFPSVGVHVLGEGWEAPYPWTAGTPHLEMMITMFPGSSFRVFRTGHLRGLRKNMFVSWDGYDLQVTPPRRDAQRPADDVPSAGGQSMTTN